MPDETTGQAAELDKPAGDRPQDLPLKNRWLPRTLVEQFEIFSKIVIVIGAIFAAREYFDRRDDMRVARTLEFVTRFDAPEYLGPRQAVGQSLARTARELRDRARAEGDTQASDELIKARAKDAVLSAVLDGNDGKGLETEVGQIASFFSSLEVCVEHKLCDADTAHAVFDGYAQSFWKNLQVYFQEARTTTPQAGAGLEKFVSAAK